MRAVARWVKVWAESLLKELEDGPVEPVRAPVPPPSPPAPPDTEGAPEHWRRLLEAKRRGPPADWVERVQRGAPHLLEGLEVGQDRGTARARVVDSGAETLGAHVDVDKEERLSAQLAEGFQQLEARHIERSLELTRSDAATLVAMGPSSRHVEPADVTARLAALEEPVHTRLSVRLGVYRKATRPR